MTRLAIIYTRAQLGLEAPLVTIEVHISCGLPRLSVVGLLDAEVKESKDRVRSAIINSGYEFPTRRITINLAPADLRKEGGRFDLPIALGILIASEQIKVNNIAEYEFAGELALSGELRTFKGALPFAIGARNSKRILILPSDNAFEAAMPQDNIIFPAANLQEVCDHLQGSALLPRYEFKLPENVKQTDRLLDIADIQGQTYAKRSLEIAAAGRHSLLLIGPPGTGKTMLASRLPSIMAELTVDEALEVAAVYSLSQVNLPNEKWRQRPFRMPHHTTSAIAMVGGGSYPKPGEISLAHHGVLFLDELPEYERRVLEVLREPLESGYIAIARASKKTVFPAKFQLIAAMNPCPCGQLGNPMKECNCSNEQIMRYQTKISGPLLDRIDMHIEVPALPPDMLTSEHAPAHETSEIIQQRVIRAMQIQIQRNNKPNNLLNNAETKTICGLDKSGRHIMQRAIEQLNLSARGYYRILKVARTIADLEASEKIQVQHLGEALGFRNKLRLQRY